MTVTVDLLVQGLHSARSLRQKYPVRLGKSPQDDVTAGILETGRGLSQTTKKTFSVPSSTV